MVLYEVMALLMCSPVLMLVTHVIFSRLLRLPSRQMIAVLSVCCAFLPLLAYLVAATSNKHGIQGFSALILYFTMVYAAVGYTYFHFFNMSETARRIRILCEIGRAGSLSKEELAKLYKSSDMIDVRLERLLNTGQLNYVDGAYAIKGKILSLAGHSVLFWRKLLQMADDL